MLRVFLLLITGIFLLTPEYKVFAKEYFVSRSCSSSNQLGTKSAPLCTIQKGLDVARAGDFVTVRGGSYTGNVTFRFSGSAGMPITLRNYPGEKVIIDQGTAASRNNPLRVTLYSGNKIPIGWIVIDGMEITRGLDGIKMYNAHDFIIRRCNIHHNLSQGILGFGLRVTIERSIIAHNGNAAKMGWPADTNQLHGIYLSGTKHKIINNVIHSNLGFGLQVAGYSPTRPEYYNQEYGGASGWLIANNTFAYQKNRGAMTLWQKDAKNNTIINNIFYENGTSYGINGVNFGDGVGNILKNNLFYSSTNKPAIAEKVKNSYTASGNLMQTNPQLVSPSIYNFRLLSGSPAINKGLKTPLVLIDFNGASRTTPDIGAFEYGSSSTLRMPSSVLNLRVND